MKKKLTLPKRVSVHKLDFSSILKFIAFLWDLPPTSYRRFPLSPHPQTRWVRSIKRLKLWSMVRLLGKSMQNMSETSLKNAYTTPWVKSTAAWYCRLIRSKMKWSFPEDCPATSWPVPGVSCLQSVIFSLNGHKSFLKYSWARICWL